MWRRPFRKAGPFRRCWRLRACSGPVPLCRCSCRPPTVGTVPSLQSSHLQDVTPPNQPHDLRHTDATLLLKAGVPLKVESQRLVHSSPVFTRATYQHILPAMQA
ncbi:MAG: tyrosine-type recombinase/integrase [Acidimicrobiia bacterium]|nr:tyrosine-type recombinase/integrase [Acidimicrobiia bacterium]